jgi:diacylglycerol kinase (ATP)
VLSTTPADAGSAQARRALEAGADLIIAAGGDGRSALAPRSSLAGRCRSPSCRPALAAEAALRVAFGGHERQIDLALADGLPFAAMAGIGLDAP